MKIDVAIPTLETTPRFREVLECLHTAEKNADNIEIQSIWIEEKSEDNMFESHVLERFGWPVKKTYSSRNLPEARENLIDSIQTDWFLFLDDDVYLEPNYLQEIECAMVPSVGAIQGRKQRRDEHPSDWVHRRSRRGGLHASMIQRDAVKGIQIPSELEVLEDEYIRREIESRGYVWLFNHQARFRHENQGRHEIGWLEGYLGSKYRLSNLHDVALNVPYSIVVRRNPIPHLKRCLGWIHGYTERGDRVRGAGGRDDRMCDEVAADGGGSSED